MNNNKNTINPLSSNSYQNIMNPMLANSFQNLNNPMLQNSYPNVNNMNNMNFPTMLNMNNMNMNNMNMMNMNMMNMNMMNNQNNYMNNCNMNNMNQNMVMNNMNNINANQNNIINNLNKNNMIQNNNNLNFNNSNENDLVNNLNNMNLNNRYVTLYKDNPNYKVSEGTKLILENNQISRGKLISNSQAVSPTLQCAICMDLVMNPVECKNCSKLFCKYCIDNWIKISKECPNKHEFAKKEELDEWIKSALSKIFIKCPYKGCGSDYAYKNWTAHVKICKFKSKGIKPFDEDTNNDVTTDGDEPFKWDKVQFFVKDIHDRTHIFELPLSTTVRELKEKLEEKTGFNVGSQRLTVNGKEMDNSKMLEFYGLTKDQTIYQLGRLKGGNKKRNNLFSKIV